MKIKKKTILFITPTMAKTGSEVALFNIINHLNPDEYRPIVMSLHNGALLKELPKNVIKPFILRIFRLKIANFFRIYLPSIYFFIFFSFFYPYIKLRYKPDVWYLNTLFTSFFSRFKAKKKVKCIFHLHELEPIFHSINHHDIQNFINNTDAIIACSQAAANVLKTLGRSNNVHVFNPSLDFNSIDKILDKPVHIKNEYQIPQDSFLWSMSGTIDLNKNPLIFVDIANQIIKKRPNTYFMWIGGDLSNGLSYYSMKKAEFYGIAKNIIWTGKTKHNYYHYLNACDGFLLTSTKESFSIVTLESIYLKKPVVSFDCLGVREILTKEIGIISDSWDIDRICDKILDIMDHKVILNPEEARKKALNFHIQNTIHNFENILKSVIY